VGALAKWIDRPHSSGGEYEVHDGDDDDDDDDDECSSSLILEMELWMAVVVVDDHKVKGRFLVTTLLD
jgi:hypothetical protein